MKRKTVKIGVFAVIIAVASVFIAKQSTATAYGIAMSNVVALTAGEAGSGSNCHNGGPGASACSIAKGITISGFGVTKGCSVACNSGYYACCGMQCTCVKES